MLQLVMMPGLLPHKETKNENAVWFAVLTFLRKF